MALLFHWTSLDDGTPLPSLIRTLNENQRDLTRDLNNVVLSRSVATPAQIVANQNDYAIGSMRVVRMSTDASRTITGFRNAGPGGNNVPNAELTVINVGTQSIVFSHQDTNSVAANRFLMDSAANITLAANDSITFYYDQATARWRNYAGPVSAFTGNLTYAQLPTGSGVWTVGGTLGINATNVNVTGNGTVSGSFSVTGATTLTGNVIVTGGVIIAGTVTNSGATTISGALTVTGAAVFGSAVTLSSTLNVVGAVTVTGAAVFGSTVSITGAQTVSGNLTVTGNAAITGTITVTGAAVFKSTASVAGAATITGTLTVTGTCIAATTITTGDRLSGTTSVTGSSGLASTYFEVFGDATNGASMTGYGSTNDWTLRNRNGAVVARNPGNTTGVTFTGTLTTQDPNSGAGAWMLGTKITGAVTADTTRYLEVNVGGSVYKVIIST
jgi:hypothetical protein